jgi:Cof subfamily protein (haloacid dehalogenase superfamily)
MIDLHVHSTYSDGTFSTKELVDYAIEKGLSAFALTDHDCVSGLKEITEYAASLKEKGIKAPRVISGIELSTDDNGSEVHVVGLFIDYESKAFKDYIDNFVKSRLERNLEMCKKLSDAGFDVKYEDLLNEFPGAVITRAHVANHMQRKGYVKSKQEAFERYIGNHGPYYVPRKLVTPKLAIELILKSGGVPILAHPILYHLSKNNLDKLVCELKQSGLMGIEAVYSTYTAADERDIRKLAEKYHLLLSGGSDFHGANKEKIDLGVGYGKLYVPDEFLEKIENANCKLLFTDMDRTLLREDCTISDELKKAFDEMVKKHHKLILTSGRPLPGITERLDSLDLNYPETYAIAFNGGLIYDVTNKKPLYVKKIGHDIIKKVEAMCKEEGLYVHSYTDEEIITLSDSEELAFYRIRIHMPYRVVKSLASTLRRGAYKLQIISLNDRDKLERIKARIMDAFGSEVDTVFSSTKYLEILPKGVGKGDAVKRLSEMLSVPIDRTFAAGDEDNDISMIKAAGTGVAVSNATPAVKEAADIITKNDNEHDGLLEIVNEYFL